MKRLAHHDPHFGPSFHIGGNVRLSSHEKRVYDGASYVGMRTFSPGRKGVGHVRLGTSLLTGPVPIETKITALKTNLPPLTATPVMAPPMPGMTTQPASQPPPTFTQPASQPVSTFTQREFAGRTIMFPASQSQITTTEKHHELVWDAGYPSGSLVTRATDEPEEAIVDGEPRKAALVTAKSTPEVCVICRVVAAAAVAWVGYNLFFGRKRR